MTHKIKKTRRTKASPPAPEKFYRARLTRRELQDIMMFAKGLARASGVLAMSYYGRANPTLKYDYDLVTEADLAVQEYIRKEVKATYPAHLFLGEEGPDGLAENDGREPVWVVDPVEGSASFSAGMPVWGVSIGLFDGSRPVLGLIHLPVTGELYSAMAGGPAMLNDRQIEVREDVIDNESLLLTYSRFHSDYITHFPGKVRSLGSTAAHLAYLARGAASGVILGNNHIWDVAAGAVLLESAGGSIRTLNGKKVDLSQYLHGEHIDQTLVAAPRGQHREIGSMIERR